MKYWISLFLFFFSYNVLATVPVSGSFQAKQSCPAYVSKNKKTNPDGMVLKPNQVYSIHEANRPNHPNWLRVEIPDNPTYPLRWVNSHCGQAKFSYEQLNCNKNPGLADAYVLALSWQPGFCQTYGYEAGKPECLCFPSDSYSASHLTLHGLWPNQKDCGHAYGFCGTEPQFNYCNYQPLDFNQHVASLLRLLMPSFAAGSCLDRHEWYKHGSCQLLSSNDYFSLAIRLTQEAQSTILGKYLSQHVGETVALAKLREVIKHSFGKDNLGKVYLGCKNGYLVDIFIQLPALIPFNDSLTTLMQKAKGIGRNDGCPKNVKISNFSN